MVKNQQILDGKIKLNRYVPMSEAEFSKLRKTWLLLPFRHPQAYWQHRALFQGGQVLHEWMGK